MGCCVSTAGWKREQVVDHKFDYIDVAEFYSNSWWRKVQYMMVFAVLLKSILVYVADFWTAYLLLTGSWTNDIKPAIPIEYSKWIFFACIIMSYLLLLWELRKARRIVRSHDIAYSFTNLIASRYYSMLSYAHFCLFRRIDKSATKTEAMAFFIFFRLKGWKRILLAEAPRQVINGFTMWAIVYGSYNMDIGKVIRHEQYANLSRQIAFALMAFTFLWFAISAVALFLAFVLYIPLLMQIRGNLKEYVCHLVDKRIADLLKKNKKRRMIDHMKWQMKRAASASGSVAGKSRKGSVLNGGALDPRQPTLPKIDHVDEVAYGARSGPGSVVSAAPSGFYAQSGYSKAPPPVPVTPPQYQRSIPPRPGTSDSGQSGYASSSQRTFVSPPPNYAPPPVPPMPQGYARAPPVPSDPEAAARHNPLLQQYRSQVRTGEQTAPYRPAQHQAPPQLQFDQSSDVGSRASDGIYPEDSVSMVGAPRMDAHATYGVPLRMATRGVNAPIPEHSSVASYQSPNMGRRDVTGQPQQRHW